MKREVATARPDYKKSLTKLGLNYFLSDEIPYWNEQARYRFTEQEVDTIEAATQELHNMCLQAVDYVIKNKLCPRFGITPDVAAYIEKSWDRGDPFIYGRFDLSYDGIHPPKMLEYNADTPTSLPEAAVAQWYWLEDNKESGVLPKDADQFNSIHDSLITSWKKLAEIVALRDPVYFTTYMAMENDQVQNVEDFVNMEYMRGTADQGGIKTKTIDLVNIGWNGVTYTDKGEKPIKALYKLYPWEFLTKETFGKHLAKDTMGMIEPPWKMLLSNKAILAVLWELFPNHPNLLPAYLEEGKLTDNYVKKPLLGREGGNVTIVEKGVTREYGGVYGQGASVFQALQPLPDFDGHRPVIGSWITLEHAYDWYDLPTHPGGGRAVGMGIREGGEVTNNTSRFVPHYFVPEGPGA